MLSQFPVDKFYWSAAGATSYFEYLVAANADKAVELAQSMTNSKLEEGAVKTWINQLALAQAFAKAERLITGGKNSEAVAALNEIKLPRYPDFGEHLAMRKSYALEAGGNAMAAYDSLAAYYAKDPTDKGAKALQQLGSKLGKNSAKIKEDIVKVRKASAQPATPFTLEQYFKPGTASTSDYKGEVTLITYWFPGCGPCRGEFPHFENVVKKFKDRDFVYLGINIVPAQDEYVLPFLKNSGYSFIPLREVKDRKKGNLDNRGLAPVNFLLDKQGNVIFSWFRTDGSNERTLELMISELLES